MIEANGFQIERQQELQFSTERAEKFYGEHRGKYFYPRLIQFITSGPLCALELKRDDAIAGWRKLIGPSLVEQALVAFR